MASVPCPEGQQRNEAGARATYRDIAGVLFPKSDVGQQTKRAELTMVSSYALYASTKGSNVDLDRFIVCLSASRLGIEHKTVYWHGDVKRVPLPKLLTSGTADVKLAIIRDRCNELHEKER